MKKPQIITSVVAIAAVLAITYLAFASPSSPPTSDATRTTTTSPSPAAAISPTPAPAGAPSATPAPAASNPGRYQDYTSSSLATTSGTKIIFFHAPWCPQCRALESSIKAGTIPAGVTIFKVDYDSNQALRQKYGVTIQTTLVKVADDGSLVKKYVAYQEPSLASLKQNLLP